jgi:FKBP-type peptidyl-prolyl cis-trans isomerase
VRLDVLVRPAKHRAVIARIETGLRLGGLALVLAATACARDDAAPAPAPSSTASPSSPPVASPAPAAPPAASPESVSITILAQGSGPEAKAGDKVSVLYVGAVGDGTRDDPSLDRAKPLVFTVGQRGVVRGVNDGVVGMKVGEKRKIVVPPSRAYGDQSSPTIPAHATLVFEVQLIGIEAK